MSNASLELGGGKWGTKDGNLLGYASSTSSSKFVPREFTFTRGSDIAATRVNSSGVIEKYRENLLTYSNDFSTWSKVELNSTPNQADPFGGNTATLITTTGTTFGWIRQQPTNTGVQTISFYVKAGSNTKFTAGLIQSPYPQTTFTLTGNGAKSSNAGVIDSTITLVGNGWYRCSMTYNITSTYEIRFYPNDTINKTIGDSVYIYGFQLEKGLVATSYLDSGATTATSGVADNEPRINYRGGTASLLLEPSSTNLITQSEYLEGYNQITNLSLDLTNETTSPERLNNSYALTTTSTSALIRERINPLASGTYTFSFYAKYDSSQFIAVRNSYLAASFDSYVWFDIQNKTKGTTSGNSVVDYDIEDVGNGWVRCYVTTTSASSGDSYFFIYFADSDGGFSTTIGNKLYLYGWQLEEGSYPTSYIPTYGTSVTRSVDDISTLHGVGVGGDEFTIFLEFDLSDTPLVNNLGKYFQTFDSSNNSQQEFRFFTIGGEQVLIPYFRQDGSYAFGTGSNAVRFDGKVLFRADGGGTYTMFFGFNGSSTKEVRTGLTAYTLDKIDFISRPKTNLKQFLIFNKALSDAECITLTT